MEATKTEQHKINASGKRLGRVACEVAILLMGKHRSDAVRNTVVPVMVTVENVSKLDISEKKRGEKMYKKYSGYPGGLRIFSMQKLIEKKRSFRSI